MSGLIPQPFIDELLLRVDLVEFIESYVPLKRKGSNHIACCPFHQEKTPSFIVNAKKQFYHCFGCNASGNAISFAMNYLNQGFIEAVDLLAKRIGIMAPSDGKIEKKQNSINPLYKILQDICLYYQSNLINKTEAQDYLKHRKITKNIANHYQLGFAIQGWHNLEKIFATCKNEMIDTGMLIKTDDGKLYDRYRMRLMFPIHDRQGRIIGFGGRVLEKEQKPKYLNSPETILFQKSRELYGLHQIISLQKTIASIIVVEGYMDVIALAQYGITNVVATLGTATSSYHIQLLAKYTKQLIFCFDGDTPGRQAAWRALESTLPHLHLGLDASFIFLPQAQDPDSIVRIEGAESFLQRLQQAVPLHRFLLDTLVKDINLQNLAGKTQLINAVKPFLLKMSNGSYKHLLIDELSRLTRIQQDNLCSFIADESPTLIKEKNTIKRTPLRIALALLLQNPELYIQTTASIDSTLLDAAEHKLLIEIINLLKSNPNSNTANLLEAWRNDSNFDLLKQLAAWDHQVPEKELMKEFIDTMLFLQRQNGEQFIRKLIEKSRIQGLTQPERKNLQEMLKKRHKYVQKS